MDSRQLKLKRLFILLFFLLSLTSPTFAQDSVTDDEVNDVAKGLYCPVCESTPLDACPTQACIDWRELIREQLESGMSKEEIYTYFSVQYGDGVLAEPPRSGFGLALWVAPLIAIALGGVVFVKLMRQMKTTESKPLPRSEGVKTAVTKATPVSQSEMDSYLAQIEAELQELSNG